jgi:uncharacterized protein YgbK (DUF1537 family)
MWLQSPARASPPAARYGVIADDLTGACDAGVQFAGFSALVRLDPAVPVDTDVELTVLVTHSRRDPPETARAKIQSACQQLREEGRTLLYQKIDSTLRGNLGVEISAAQEFSGASLAIVAPAFPAQGRALAGGWLHVAGSASRRTHLPTLLRDQGVARVAHLGRNSLAGGPQAVRMQIDQAAQEAAVLVMDATSPEDLDFIARAAMDCQASVLAVGSAGLAAAVARLLAMQYHRAARSQSHPRQAEGKPGPVALLLGSTTPTTAEQTAHFIMNHRSAVFDLPSSNLRLVRLALRERRHLILNVAFRGELRRCLTRCLKVFKDYQVRGVILSGGDTAALVCQAWEVAGIQLESEIAPGIPWGHLAGGPAQGMPVATKAGGFGDRDALTVMAAFLAGRPQVFP